MRHGSLFTGIGGFDLAAEWMGWENVFQVEKDKWCQKLLKQNFPNTDKHLDIFDFDGNGYKGTVDIISGGFPCQPFSIAGKRKGNQDDRHLWPEMLRVIREVQPKYVVGENVRGLLNWNGGVVFEQVCADLEGFGYELQSFIIPACATGAPHRRDRLWIVAYNNSFRFNGNSGQNEIHSTKGRIYAQCGGEQPATMGASTYSDGATRRCKEDSERQNKEGIFSEHKRLSSSGNAANSISERCQEHDFSASEFGKRFGTGIYNAAVPNWEGFPTQSPVCRRDDGLPNRVGRIKGLGNAIVPQVAYNIFQSLHQTDLILN